VRAGGAKPGGVQPGGVQPAERGFSGRLDRAVAARLLLLRLIRQTGREALLREGFRPDTGDACKPFWSSTTSTTCVCSSRP
jgi:hypothetical protein